MDTRFSFQMRAKQERKDACGSWEGPLCCCSRAGGTAQWHSFSKFHLPLAQWAWQTCVPLKAKEDHMGERPDLGGGYRQAQQLLSGECADRQ